jgi:hypothetical protein
MAGIAVGMILLCIFIPLFGFRKSPWRFWWAEWKNRKPRCFYSERKSGGSAK